MTDKIKIYDKNFTESEFKTFIDNVFIQIHLSVMKKNLETTKHFMNNKVFNIFEEKIKHLEETKTTQIYDEINVKSTDILNVDIVDNKIAILVKITSRYMDYIIDENGNKISGDDTKRIERENYLIFEKSIYSIEQKNLHKCFNCGADIEINANGICPYCRQSFDLERTGWILTSFEVRL